MIYQSDAFGTTLAQLFDLARLLGSEASPARRAGGRSRRPLPCLLLDGESGTGKRGLAALFHAATDRRKAPMAVASCNELTNETLLRSILFGHKRGAFTDAREDRPGLVATAGQGDRPARRLPPPADRLLGDPPLVPGGRRVQPARRGGGPPPGRGGGRPDRRDRPLARAPAVGRAPAGVPGPGRAAPAERSRRSANGPTTSRPRPAGSTRVVSAEVGAEVELADDAVAGAPRPAVRREQQPRAAQRRSSGPSTATSRETDVLTWSHLRPFVTPTSARPRPRRDPGPASPRPLPRRPSRSPRPERVAAPAPGPGGEDPGQGDGPRRRAEAEALVGDPLRPDPAPLWAAIEAARASPGSTRRSPCRSGKTSGAASPSPGSAAPPPPRRSWASRPTPSASGSTTASRDEACVESSILVPTLRVGMPSSTLRVGPVPTRQGRRADAERPGSIPTRSVGTRTSSWQNPASRNAAS